MTNTEIKALAKKAFPEYRGRKFRSETRRSYQMTDYWSEGSRNHAYPDHALDYYP